jgi:hypothetical protein
MEDFLNEFRLMIFANQMSECLGYHGFNISFNKEEISNYNKQLVRRAFKLSHSRLKKMIQKMSDGGWLTYQKGFYDQINPELSKKSLILPSPNFIELCRNCVDIIKNPKKSRRSSEIIFKRCNGELITTKVANSLSKKKMLQRYNSLLFKQDISLDGVKLYAEYKRVFYENTEGHGRFYSVNSLQSMSKSNRLNLKFNGSCVSEVDFKSIHPRILYTLAGLPLNKTAYPNIEHLFSCTNNVNFSKSCKKLSKLALLILLNTDSIGCAKNALWRKCRTEKSKGPGNALDSILITTTSIKDAVEYLWDYHGPIQSLIREKHDIPLWARLQNIDASIAEKVINFFVQDGACILPWHDSFLVAADQEERLKLTMTNSWEDVMGTKLNSYDLF